MEQLRRELQIRGDVSTFNVLSSTINERFEGLQPPLVAGMLKCELQGQDIGNFHIGLGVADVVDHGGGADSA